MSTLPRPIPPARRISLSPTAVVLLALSFGLCAGYLDLGIMLFKKVCWDKEGYIRTGRDFLWTVPVGHAVLLMVPGLMVAVVNRLRPRPISPRVVLWLFATLAIWSALLRLPLYAAGSLLLAAGLGRVVSNAVAAGLKPRQARYTLAGLAGLLIVLAALSSGWQTLKEYRTVVKLPPAPSGARNVVLIVWDTVRAYSLSLHGYGRDTTPNLTRWARHGVRYDRALRRRRGRTPRIARSSPASGRSGSIPSGITYSTPRIRPWPSTWPRGAIRPPGSRRTRAIAVMRPGWIGASPISRITR